MDNNQDLYQDNTQDKYQDSFQDSFQDKYQDSFQDNFQDNYQDSFPGKEVSLVLTGLREVCVRCQGAFTPASTGSGAAPLAYRSARVTCTALT